MKYLILLLTIIGCASGTKISLQSEPDKADVYIFSDRSRTFELLGQTPLQLDAKDPRLQGMDTSKMSVLRIERQGYSPENVLIPGNKLQDANIVLNLKPNEQWISKDSLSISKVAEDIARSLHQINNETNSQKYTSALKRINSLLSKYPETSIFYDIKGSLHLLLDQRDQAKRSFKKSLELNPSNMKTKKMIEKIN